MEDSLLLWCVDLHGDGTEKAGAWSSTIGRWHALIVVWQGAVDKYLDIVLTGLDIVGNVETVRGTHQDIDSLPVYRNLTGRIHKTYRNPEWM